VGTFDGFWAFEMERRGAAEVVAIDLDDHTRLDWPDAGPPELDTETLTALKAREQAFQTAHRALGSSVQRRDLSIYDLSTDAVGDFDFVFLGTLLLHLRDPIGALMAVRQVLRPGGQLLVNDVISLSLLRRHPTAQFLGDTLPFWWICNIAGLRRMVEAAGFTIAASGGPYFEPNGPTRQIDPPPSRRALRQHLERQLLLRLGAPHAWVRATPA
jgi:tRNA (mo5U34)-methyltransferase